MMRRLRSLRRDQHGASALEFALIAPMFIIGFFGLVETGQVILAGRRTSHAANVLGDLIAQKTSVASADFTDCFAAGGQMIIPMSSTNLQMKVTSVTQQSNGKATVDWSQASGMSADTKGATYTPPAGMLTNTGDSVIVATANYTLLQATSYVLANNFAFNRVSYAKPRSGTQVTCPTC